MKAISRKYLTVDEIVRSRISFRLGQKAVDLEGNAKGVIIALTNEGGLLQCKEWKGDRWFVNRWFVEYKHLRPCDERRYV